MVDSVHPAPNALPPTPKFPYIRETFGFTETSSCGTADSNPNPFLTSSTPDTPDTSPDTPVKLPAHSSPKKASSPSMKRIFTKFIMDILRHEEADKIRIAHENHHHETEVDNVFKIKNLDTGEVIDIRDENQEAFTTKFAQLTSRSPDIDLEDYFRKRELNNKLWETAEKNDYKLCKSLLDPHENHGIVAQPNSKGLNDWTALHIAADKGHIDVCEILLYHGELTNINAKTTEKRSPLHLACLKGHTPVVELFIQEEANVNCLDIDQNTPLHYASMFGHVDIVKKLLKAKAKAGLRNLKGYYPIDIAASSKIVKTIKRYFKRKKDILISCGYGRSALHGHILSNSRLDVVNRLLSNAQFLNKDSDMQSRLPRNSIQEFSARASTGPKPTEQIDIRKAGPDDFEGLGLLGRGSFGEVYLVRERRTQKVYALKILRKSEVVGTNIVKYTYTERNILSTTKHPFIVSLHSSFQTKEKLALVIDYCPGGDLGSYIHREGKFSEDRARIYLCEILLALEELHKNGIIFRDLKPENIVLDREGHAILTDFGLSKEGVVHGQLQKSFCGSIAYLAPEMLKRKGHDKNVDWYLLGALLYEMLHGEPPFYCEDQDVLFNRILKGRLEISKELSEGARDLLKRVISIQLLERNPTKRIGSGRRDAYEIKKHPFFKGINWDDVKRRKLKPPPPISYNKKLKKANRDEMFGYSEIREETKLDGWSFVHNPNRTKK